MQVNLYDWDELYEKAMGKAFGSPILKAKDEARAWYEYEFATMIDRDMVEDSIDEINDNLDTVPMFDCYGNFVCYISKGNTWRYE